MEWTRSGEDLFVRLDPGEEIHASLQALADEVGFDAAAITSGIGRTRNSTYGYMDDDHVYHRATLEAGAELVTLQGNLARRDNGDAFNHLHGLMRAICFPPPSMWLPRFTCAFCPTR